MSVSRTEFVRLDALVQLINARGGNYRHVAGPEERSLALAGTAVRALGLSLAGVSGTVPAHAIRVYGREEDLYMQSQDPRKRPAVCARCFDGIPAMIVVADGLEPDTELLRHAQDCGVPVYASPLASEQVVKITRKVLQLQQSPRTTIHAGMVDVLGVGVLITGESGVGKSEVALDLVLRGHRLVSDDRVDVVRDGDTLFGSGPELTRNYMEVRGLGIINVRDLYGISAVRVQKKLELVIELQYWKDVESIDRLGLERQQYALLDVNLPKVQIPVSPGRNIAGIVEVAVRNHLLRLQGIDSARALTDRLSQELRESGRRA